MTVCGGGDDDEAAVAPFQQLLVVEPPRAGVMTALVVVVGGGLGCSGLAVGAALGEEARASVAVFVEVEGWFMVLSLCPIHWI